MFPSEKFQPWNKDKSVGQKKPLTLAQMGHIQRHLDRTYKLRDLALFSTAFDTMLRGSDLLSLKVEDVTDAYGRVRSEFPIRQRKTKTGLAVGITSVTQQILKRWITHAELHDGCYLFPSMRSKANKPISTDQYRNLVKTWVKAINLDPADYSSHSLRRTKASMIYDRTKDVGVVKHLLGHKSISSTYSYLNIEHQHALRVAREFHL